jgi:hypothetical protein
MATLATESATVQNPLVRHAGDIGWEIVPQSEAVNLRKGEGGMGNYFLSGVIKVDQRRNRHPIGYKTLH